jgi:hypothetical protein
LRYIEREANKERDGKRERLAKQTQREINIRINRWMLVGRRKRDVDKETERDITKKKDTYWS